MGCDGQRGGTAHRLQQAQASLLSKQRVHTELTQAYCPWECIAWWREGKTRIRTKKWQCDKTVGEWGWKLQQRDIGRDWEEQGRRERRENKEHKPSHCEIERKTKRDTREFSFLSIKKSKGLKQQKDQSTMLIVMKHYDNNIIPSAHL